MKQQRKPLLLCVAYLLGPCVFADAFAPYLQLSLHGRTSSSQHCPRSKLRKLLASSRASSSSADAVDTVPTRTITVSLNKPLGLVLETEDDDQNAAVRISSMDASGSAAASATETTDWIGIGDVVTMVNGNACRSFEDVMDRIIESEDPVEISVERPISSVGVHFQKAVSVVAEPGAHLCDLALDAGHPLEYQCRNGVCGTCECVMSVDGKKKRFVRPCVATVPSKCRTIEIGYSDRFE